MEALGGTVFSGRGTSAVGQSGPTTGCGLGVWPAAEASSLLRKWLPVFVKDRSDRLVIQHRADLGATPKPLVNAICHPK